MPDLHLSWTFPASSREQRAAALRADQQRLAQVTRQAEDAHGVLARWLGEVGAVPPPVGDVGRTTIPYDRLAELVRVLKQVQEQVGPVACGVGRDAREAELARQVGEKRGGQVLVWTPELGSELEKSETQEQPEQDPLLQALVGRERELSAAPTTEDQLRQLAELQGQQDQQEAQQALQRREVVRRQVGQLLQALRAQAGPLEQIKEGAPEVYQAIAGLTRGVAMLAREVGVQDSLGKSDRWASLAGRPPSPEGLISPQGEWIPLRGGSHLIELRHRSGLSPYLEDSGNAYEAGWITVGHAGGDNVSMHSSLPSDHPAVLKLREVGAGCWGQGVEIEHEQTAQQPFGTYDARHFCKTGEKRSMRSTSTHSLASLYRAELAKMALADNTPGEPVEDFDEDFPEYDYSHMLAPEHKAAGYRLTVEQGKRDLNAYLYYGDKHIGKVRGEVHGEAGPFAGALGLSREGARGKYLNPHSYLDPAHRGKGLGSAMYEALYTHAYHDLDIRRVRGAASEDAAAVHQRLADKHDFDVEGYDSPEGWEYRYNLKSEGLRSVCDAGLAKARLPMPRAPQRTFLHLPPGTVDPATGKFKIVRADGKAVWHQGRMGVIASRRPATAAAGFGYMTSSRNPEG